MKKYCLVTILLTLLMSMPMFAYDFVQNGIYYNIEDDHVSVTYSGNGVYSGSVSIPSQVTYDGVTYPVTAIGEWAFEGGEGITSLRIPSSITSIGEYAFIDCGSNIEVKIEDLTAWCKVTFGNVHSSPLSSAKKFYLSSSEVKQLVIPEGVESIPNYAFYQCRSITSLEIAGSVKSIGSSAFEDCTGLNWVRLSEGVESIGGSSFEGCSGLSTIILPSTLSSIALNAFKNCSNLNTIVSRIQEPFAFVDNVFSTYSTATVIVPEGTTTAYQSTDGWNLFDNITDDSSHDPTKPTIHVATAGTLSSLISADEKYQIEELTLTGELNGTDFKLIRDMAGITFFFNARSGHEVHELKSTDGKLMSLDLTSAKIVKGGSPYLILDERPTARPLTRTGVDYEYYTEDNSITSRLFADTRLVSIIIPSSITSINTFAFSKSKLTSIAVGQGNQYYDSRDNCNAIIESNSNRLIVGCKSTIIPYSVESIGASAFYGCSGLTSITIPNSVKSIGGSAFMKCSGLTSITIPSSVESIDGSAFSGCSGLTSITIPNSVESIGGSAFSGCSGLTSITIPNSVTSIGDNAFYGCSGLTSIIVESGNQYYDSRNNCNAIIEKTSNTLIVGCKNTTIPNNVKSIGNYAFNNCSGLTSVTIPNSVTSIGSYAFHYCSGLTSVTIGNSVASIGQAAFSGCSGLKSVHISDMKAWCGVSFYFENSNPLDYAHHLYLNGKEVKDLVIPDGVTTIGRYAFYDCSGLETVTISKNVKSIGERAFQGCSGLIKVSISDGVTSIGICAFSDCNGLTSVTIGSSVESIGKSAFSGCSGLTSILSLNNTPPTCDGTYVFNNVDKENCVLWVPKGSVAAYWEANGWKDFQNIKEIVDGDVNLDEKVNRNDQNALVAHIMGEKPEGFFEGLADLNGDDDVNAADVVTLVDILNNGGLSTETEFSYDNIDGSLVVSSLTCTLNNKRDEAILLTKCELYSNGSLLRTKSFSSNPVSIAAGGNKSCTFENLSKPANGTDFSVCWHYMVDDESFVYRCPFAD